MSGSSRSLVTMHVSGLRIGFSSYHPAHNKNGVNVSARCVMSAYMNIASRANNGEGRSEPLTLVAWGKLADVCARSCSPGKEINVSLSPHVYDGRVYHNNQPVQMSDGTFLTTKKTSYTIERITFGEESAKLIADEIAAGIRPQFWNIPGHQDAETWRATLKARAAVQFDASQAKFGYAEVRLPQGPGISAYNPALERNAGTPAVETQVQTAVADAASVPTPTPVAGPQLFAQPQTQVNTPQPAATGMPAGV